MMFNKDAKKLGRKLEKIVDNRRAKMKRNVSREVVYERMIKDAVKLISRKWEGEAMDNYNIGSGMKLEAYDVFWVRKADLSLFGNMFGSCDILTGRMYFSEPFKFESMEEVEKYVVDVKARLPENIEVVSVEREKYTPDGYATSICYSFYFKVKD